MHKRWKDDLKGYLEILKSNRNSKLPGIEHFSVKIESNSAKHLAANDSKNKYLQEADKLETEII